MRAQLSTLTTYIRADSTETYLVIQFRPESIADVSLTPALFMQYQSIESVVQFLCRSWYIFNAGQSPSFWIMSNDPLAEGSTWKVYGQ